jgi:hypothetical protein
MRSGRGRLCGKWWRARRRRRFLEVSPSRQAAVGFRVHSGWAAVVAVSIEKGTPVVLARQRVHLVDTFAYKFRQPYHTAERMRQGQAGEFIERMREGARRLAQRAIEGLQSDLQKQGIALKSCGLLLASGRPLPALEKILASHALIHTADGEHFREAIVHASGRCGLAMSCVKEKELLERAGEAFRLKPKELLRRITELGRPLGPPWSQDEKFATIAAWLALARPSKSIAKGLE